jgi:hypothetical protein
MSSDDVARASALLALVAAALLVAAGSLTAQAGRTAPTFYPDDPLRVDDDAAFDAGGVEERELSEAHDFLENTFGRPGERTASRAANVNTMDEVPDSSWFTNRIGVRDLSAAELVRGPNTFATVDPDEWTIVSGKGPGGFHPGFRAVHAGDPGRLYQLEVDPPDHPQLTGGAELIGTLIYHALGYNVVEVYLTRIHPARIRISEKATIRDASGVRRFTRADLDAVLRLAARDRDGRVHLSASRFEEGKNLGQFLYHGTRTDDPNDIHPHEHRRELRANRVFGAWLAHDDSRAVNTLDMLVETNGRRYVRHYMYDFGAILGSATRFPDAVVSGHEYFVDRPLSLKRLWTLGLYVPPHLAVRYPTHIPPSVGFFTAAGFEPAAWKPNYPNAAFENMQPDDAFWGARLVSRFSDDVIRTIIEAVGYDDPAAVEHLTAALVERRDRIARVWLNAVNPVVDVELAPGGTLTFVNAAVQAGAATPAAAYMLQWSRFDNEAGTHTPIGDRMRVSDTRAQAPQLPSDAAYVAVEITAEHREHDSWRRPVQVYFRRTGGGWVTVGIYR